MSAWIKQADGSLTCGPLTITKDGPKHWRFRFLVADSSTKIDFTVSGIPTLKRAKSQALKIAALFQNF
jgi:hypothetical protein